MAMQHTRQAPGRDIHKHFSLAPTWDDLILVTAISTAFHFLLRSSEYLRKGPSPDPEKCLRVEHIVCPINGEDESAPQGVPCTEVVMFMPGAKNDWMGQGTPANIYADEDGHPLCTLRGKVVQPHAGGQTVASPNGQLRHPRSHFNQWQGSAPGQGRREASASSPAAQSSGGNGAHS